jgi:hypothetical protein
MLHNPPVGFLPKAITSSTLSIIRALVAIIRDGPQTVVPYRDCPGGHEADSAEKGRGRGSFDTVVCRKPLTFAADAAGYGY